MSGFLIPIIHPSKFEVVTALPPLVIPSYVPSSLVLINVIPELDAAFSAVPDNVPVNVTGKTSALPLMSRLIDTLSSFDEGELAFCGLSLSTVVQEARQE